jgi:hypothetical protein
MSSDERPSENKAGAKNQGGDLLNWYRASVDLFKSAIWPTAVIFIFLSIKDPLQASLAELPGVIQSAQKVTIGNVLIERKLKDAGIPADVRKALAKLSKNSLILLLETGKLGWGYLQADWETQNYNKSEIKELRNEGLMIVEKAEPGDSYPFKYSLSPAAKNAYDVVLSSIISQLAEVVTAGGKQ